MNERVTTDWPPPALRGRVIRSANAGTHPILVDRGGNGEGERKGWERGVAERAKD